MTTPQQETTLPNEPEGDDTEELDFDWEAEDVGTDTDDMYEDLTEREADEGRLLGEKIDTDDDEDAG